MRWLDVFIHPSSGGTAAPLASRSTHVLEKETGAATTRPRYADLAICFVSRQEMSCVRTDVWTDLLCLCAHVHILTTARLVPVENQHKADGHFYRQRGLHILKQPMHM